MRYALVSVLYNNLTLRLITAALGIPIVVIIVWASWWSTSLLFVCALVLAGLEYHNLITSEEPTWRANAFGILYLGVPLIAGLWLRSVDEGAFWILLMLFTNWLTDAGAYVAGRWLGHTPLAPRISPGKTWEGALGGMFTGFATALGFTLLLGQSITLGIILVGLSVPTTTIVGDLIESRIKRRYGVKDSGYLLPGHGGLLDRIDGTIFAMVATAVIVLLLGL